MQTAIWIYTFVALAALLACGLRPAWLPHRPAAKLAASLGFVLLALCLAWPLEQHAFSAHMLPGFLCCLAGDGLLSIQDEQGKKRFLLPGMLAFMLAHLFFAAALLWRTPGLWRFSLPWLTAAFSAFATYRLDASDRIYAGKHLPAAMLYSAMVSVVLGLGVLQGGVGLMLGFFLFWFSDALLLLVYFGADTPRWIHTLNTVCYYSGQILLACAAAQL